MSTPQTARERFEAWRKEKGLSRYKGVIFDYMLMIWEAAERSAIERAAKVIEDRLYADPMVRERLIQAIRSL